MTEYEVIEKLAGKGLEWCIHVDGALRVQAKDPALNNACPLTALCYLETGKSYCVRDFAMAGRDIHIPVAICLRIVGAADDNGDHDTDLRQTMIEKFKPLYNDTRDPRIMFS